MQATSLAEQIADRMEAEATIARLTDARARFRQITAMILPVDKHGCYSVWYHGSVAMAGCSQGQAVLLANQLNAQAESK